MTIETDGFRKGKTAMNFPPGETALATRPRGDLDRGPACQAGDEDPARNPSARLESWLAATLDEVDYGVVVLASADGIRFANRVAMAELRAAVALRAVDGRLRSVRGEDAGPLERALADARQRSLRRMLIVGHGQERLGLSVMPLGTAREEAAGTVVLIGKREVCPLSIAGYSRSHGLTDAEGRVLAELCRGARPQDVARRHAVSIATVRTQIGSIRAKTGATSIVALLRQLASLPPMLVALGRVEASPLRGLARSSI
ncbi:MAG TPA: helix-turn-helix transcriptional regulator [Caldimonas sp.]|nr:helix-turn-helix transcriptional regulator [Caldimonas sp.]